MSFEKYDLTTPLSEKRARLQERRDVERTEAQIVAFNDAVRKGKRTFVYIHKAGDYVTLDVAREYARRLDLHLEAIFIANQIPQVLEIMHEKAEHIDIVLLCNGDEISWSNLTSLLWAARSSGVEVRPIALKSKVRRLLCFWARTQ